MKLLKSKNIRVSAVVIGLSLLLFSMPFSSANPYTIAALDGTVEAALITTGPTIDGTIDAVWSDATAISIEVALGVESDQVVLKFLYDSQYLYILSQWNDTTMSMVRGAQGYDPVGYSGAWMFNTTGDSWIHQIGGSEDRMTFMWDINATGFDGSGCMVKCHGSGTSDSYLTTPGEFGDMWHMKAARCLPTISASQTGTPTINSGSEATAGSFSFLGYTDDKHVTYDEAPHEGDGGRHGDAGTETYSHNRNATKGAPIWMETAPTDFIDAMVLHQSEIDGAECFNVSEASVSQMEAAWALYDSFGAIVPERILTDPSGSRGDILQGATWIDGLWTSEMKRLLDTTHSDDVIFDPADESGYLFSIATMDNSGGSDGADIVHFHTGSTFYKLTFESEATTTPPPDYTMMYLAIGGIAIVVVVIVLIMKKR